jgi:hypothetical protein
MKLLDEIRAWWRALVRYLNFLFVLNHGCSMMGHAWDPIQRFDTDKGWVPIGTERCENCGKERPSCCHYCRRKIAEDTRVYSGYRCCLDCFDEKDSIESAFGYSHGDPRWTNEKRQIGGKT